MALRPGSGGFSVFGFSHGEAARGSAGVGLDYEHHVVDPLALFATGRAGMTWDELGRRSAWDVLGGLRWVF